ncbi:MAG: hypothetical protein HY908_32610 [Myxococcales bacterium]|nr:hypothetical protein [Myxococcales bacterium]
MTDAHFPSRTFTNPIAEIDFETHPDDELPGDSEYQTLRIGSPETLVWRVRRDIDAGHIAGHGANGHETAGLFWSVALPTAANASPRDAATGQLLRSTYSYVKTPLLAQPKPLHPPPLYSAPCLPPGGCSLQLRADQPVINPPDLSVEWTNRTPTRILAAEGTLLLTGGPSVRVEDASRLLSPIVQRLLLDGRTQWLRPVETGVRTRALGSDTMFVALPDPWDGATPVLDVVSRTGVLSVRDERPTEPPREPAPLPLDGPAIDAAQPVPVPIGGPLPGARTGARGVLSLTDGVLFLVGGRDADERPIGEIWRYDLGPHTWQREMFSSLQVGLPLAVTYDVERHTIVVLDEWEERATPLVSHEAPDGGPDDPDDAAEKVFVCHRTKKLGGGDTTLSVAPAALAAHLAHGDGRGPCAADQIRTETRLLVFERVSHKGHFVAAWRPGPPEAQKPKRYQRVSLVPLGDGSFVLFGARAEKQRLDLFRMIMAEDGTVRWTGRAKVTGTLLDEPITSASGIVAAVLQNGTQHMVKVSAGAFEASAAGPSRF